jgi:hypothetical protein
MALAASPLSQVCKGIRTYLDAEINAGDFSQVYFFIDTPSAASTNKEDAKHYLNLFFFRFEPSGLFPDSLPGETGWLRTFCLITPFSHDEGNISAGENELRLIGEVMRIFHEKPVFLLNVDGDDYHLQVIFQPLALDQLNQLWSTQGDTVYRPSLLFEISLAPVIPAVKSIPAPLTGGFGLDVQASLQDRQDAVTEHAPQVPVMTPATQLDDWTPAISFVHDQACAFSLSLALNSEALLGNGADLPAFAPQVWLAGKLGEMVSLRWETWDNAHGWQKVEPAIDVLVASERIDPEGVATAPLTALALPFNDHVGQMLLSAERQYARPGDGVLVTLRSNPLLISLYAA